MDNFTETYEKMLNESSAKEVKLVIISREVSTVGLTFSQLYGVFDSKTAKGLKKHNFLTFDSGGSLIIPEDKKLYVKEKKIKMTRTPPGRLQSVPSGEFTEFTVFNKKNSNAKEVVLNKPLTSLAKIKNI